MGARLPWEQEPRYRKDGAVRARLKCNYGSRGLVAQTRLISELRCVRFAGLPLNRKVRNHVRALETHAT